MKALATHEPKQHLFFHDAIFVQTLSSQPVTRELLSTAISSRSGTALFENILDRPEIGPAEDHAMVQGAKSPKTTYPSSLWEKHLPSSWKPVPEKKAILASSVPVVPMARKLPDEIKKIFENTSKDFGKNFSKSNASSSEHIVTPVEMDEWDRAIFFGESLTGDKETQQKKQAQKPPPKRVSFADIPAQASSSKSSSTPRLISPFVIPKKSDAFLTGDTLPTRVMDEEIARPILQKEVRKESLVSLPSIPTKPVSAPTPMSAVPKKPIARAVPIKPKTST